MSKKTIIIFVCSAFLLGSAAVAWGTVLRIVAKQAHTTSFTPPELKLNVDTRSLPQQQFIDRSFVFTD